MRCNKVTIRKWDDLWRLFRRFQRSRNDWIFRGQSNAKDGLTTSLERVAKRFGARFTDLGKLEQYLVRHFKRQAHRYLPNLPEDTDIIEWLALMRHHGAPTRLIDWTYSFFVALHFAVEPAEKNCVIWALDVHWLVETAEKYFPEEVRRIQKRDDPRLKSRAFFEALFGGRSVDLIYTTNPERLNERLIIQQGLFLAPTNIRKSFEENFRGLLNRRDAAGRLWKIRINTSTSLKKEILRNLLRMNINEATLFPGLDGFARSLKSLLATPDLLRGRLPFERRVPARHA